VPPGSEGNGSKTNRSAAETAYEFVKARLLDGRLPGGVLLSEGELAQQLGVSRTPVRQAFVQLQAEGLLELYPKRGALVVPISASEADDVHEARLLIEAHCARRVAAAGSAPVAELEAAIADQEAALQAGGAEFAAADRRFHRAIVAAAGNALLTRQYDALRDRHQRIAAATVARDPSRVERFIAEHRGILAALDRGDADDVAARVEAHLDGAHELARRPRAGA
jgi:DNA-binding GntR family transcriptional regulator